MQATSESFCGSTFLSVLVSAFLRWIYTRMLQTPHLYFFITSLFQLTLLKC